MTKILIDIDIWFIFNTTPKLANIKYKLMTIVKQVNQDAPQGLCQPIVKCNLSHTSGKVSTWFAWSNLQIQYILCDDKPFSLFADIPKAENWQSLQ